MRVDAQRNRDRILEAARALLAETGVDATMEDIARHAGVAVGTVYRHFPAKEDLVAAVVEDSLAQMASLTEGALAAVHAGAPPGAALGQLFREIAERHATDRAFKSAMGRLDIHASIHTDSPADTPPAAPPAVPPTSPPPRPARRSPAAWRPSASSCTGPRSRARSAATSRSPTSGSSWARFPGTVWPSSCGPASSTS